MTDATDRALDPKIGHYPNTILSFDTGLRVDLRVAITRDQRDALGELFRSAPFAVLTADNPHGRVLSPEENASRLRELQNALASHELHAVAGTSPDGLHVECGVALALEKAEAFVLGRRFGQTAIFWFDGERFWLIKGDQDEAPLPIGL